jgi:anaphase-promoting complex subunit 2
LRIIQQREDEAAMVGAAVYPDSMFASVFPVKSHSTATPEATPNIGVLASPGLSFGGFNAASSLADETVRFNRAWSSATRFLALPPNQLDLKPRDLEDFPDAERALYDLTSTTAGFKQLLDWYMHEIDTHFRHCVLPKLSFWKQPVPVQNARNVLAQTVAILSDAQTLYLTVGSLRRDFTSTASRLPGFMEQVKQNYHTRMTQAISRERIQKTLAIYLYEVMKEQLQTTNLTPQCLQDEYCHCEIDLDVATLQTLHDVGLGGRTGERAFALAVHRILEGPAVERRCFQVDWSGQGSVMPKLRRWIRDHFVPAAEKALAVLTGDASLKLQPGQFLIAAENNLGRSRVQSLFDYVRSWPSSQGAILDIREYLSTNGPNEKAHLCASFLEHFQRRLLHAGASTTEILGIYISVIQVFQSLDSRGVLLEKVASRIRNYLRGRDDTPSIIASSLLADVDELSGTVTGRDADKVCSEIALGVVNSAVDARNDKMVDWNDMEWMPDPIDAGPNYKSSKTDDVVAHVLALFEKEDFSKAFTAAVGDNFLHKTTADFAKEIKIIELLKARLDAGQMHNAEVMLKDMQDSVTMNAQFRPPRTGTVTPKEIQRALPAEGIDGNVLYDMFKNRIDRKLFGGALSLVATRRGNIYFPKRARLPPEPAVPTTTQPELDAKVISSHFWPEYQDEKFKVPSQAKQKLDSFEEQYKNFTGTRVVRWKHVQSRADVVLQLEDRTFEDSVEAFKASVIDVFCNERQDDQDVPHVHYDPAIGLSIDEIEDALEMPSELVLVAVHYWTSKRILYEVSPAKYAVLERLDMEPSLSNPNSTGGVDVEMDEGTIAALADERRLKEQAPMFSMFISTLLTNNGPRPVEGPMGITNMVKMVMPTFTWGDEHVLMLLKMMESEGQVVQNGENWKKAS